jgi:tetratricopeptide (TPR) repeat protein
MAGRLPGCETESVLSALDSCRYQAYVSYSHLDEKWAVWLHKKLETYRVPRQLVGRKTACGVIPKRIAPIFRDREELPTATDLSETVNKALRDSANLIVICSPRAASSRWVNEEVLTFKRLGRSDRIFCFIVGGEPSVTGKGLDECFPEGLRFHMDADGELTDQPTEPIAADARDGKDGKSDALLKLVAGIIGVGFDALKQRDLHRRLYRMVAVTAVSLSIMVLMSVLAFRAYVAEQEALQHRAQAEDLIGFMLGDLREKLEPIGRLDVLNVVGDKSIDYFDSLASDDLAPQTLAIRSKAMRQFGEVRMAQGHLDAALEAFKKSLSDAELLVEKDADDDGAKFLLAQSNFWIGYVHWDQGDLDAALQRLQVYRGIAQERVDRNPDEERWLRELGYAHTNLGVLFNARGDTTSALDQFQGAQSISRILVERDPNDLRSAFDLAEATSWAGSALDALGDLEGALEEFRAEVAIKETLVSADPRNTPWRRGLGLAHRRVGEILEVQGRTEEALGSYQKGLIIAGELTRLDTANAVWRQDLTRLTIAEGRAFLTLDQPQRALANFRIATVIMQALLAEDGSKISWQRDLAQSHILTGNALMVSGNVIDADQAVASAMPMLETMLSAHPDDRGALRLLGEAYLLNGRIKESANEMDEANYVWQRAMVTLEKLSNDTNDYRILGIQAQVLLHLDLEKEANPIIERLTAMGYAEPAYTELCSRRGMSARLVQ